ncbi:SNPC4 protein, partial [Rhinopomastus cyanomelas]|nr:SNPC4 protein [Rhinopomastus cyanomelas]
DGPSGGLDINAERERIRREIEELERSLEPGGADIQVSDCSLSSAQGAINSRPGGLVIPNQDFVIHMKWRLLQEMEMEDDSSDDDAESSLPQNPETCLQMNHVYQEVIQEKMEEVELLIAQNREQQKEIMNEFSGSKIAKAGDGRNLPANIFLGHFMKPYFKDKTTGIGPPSNEDVKEKAAQGIKSFEQLNSAKWKSREKTLLQKSVISDRLQRLLQPKLLKLSYCNQKLEKASTEMEKETLEKQIKGVEQEIEAINQLPDSDLIGGRFDEHDWEKISNIHFDGQRSSEELKKFWQNWEHPSINKKEWPEEEIEKLKEIAAKHNCLDWQTIAEELGTNRTPFQCLQKYQVYNKDLKRKEWTKSEDQMLLELVQEMRVGNHIPYKKIAYYMEGRDSAQLIYRWTKSVDPSLRKGPWTSEEDAMLLAAVKKYGERDWYKIRTEVPGRSDAQCRDRYLKALHCDVKKGKWSLEEEEKLIELVEKHGLGHWSRIASELPHRTGSQCLSKWKLMIGSKVSATSRPKKRRYEEESSCSSEMSSSSEDVELDLTDSSEEETMTSKQEPAIPSVDLWIPTQASTEELTEGRCQAPSFFFPANTDSMGFPPQITNMRTKGCTSGLINKTVPAAGALKAFVPSQCLARASNFQCGKQVLRVTLEDVRRVLRHNTNIQRKLQSKTIRSTAAALTKLSGVGAPAGQKLPGQQSFSERAYRQERLRLRRLDLDRKLLMAVTPWVGNVLLPCTLQTGKMAFHHTKAESIKEKLKSVSLTSTPLFTLFIQLFQIDTKGCMKIIHERRLRQPEPLQADARRPQQVLSLLGSSSQPGTQRNSCQGIPRKNLSRPVTLKARETSTAESSTSATQGAPPAQGQRQKPKTVSELLREKRLRESQAKKAVERTVFLAPQMLVSGPLIIQHQLQQMIPPAQAGSKPAASGCVSSQGQCAAAPLPALPSVAGSTSTVVLEDHSPSVPESRESPGASQGTELQPMSVVLQNQAFVPPQITLVPLGVESGTNKLSLSAPVTCELSSNGQQQQPVNLLPALVSPQTGSPLIPSSILPLTWVVTPQALLPATVQTVVGVPQGPPAPAAVSQTTVTSSGLGAPPVAAGASTPHPSSAEAKAPSTPLAEGLGLGKTADCSTVLLTVTSVSPGCPAPSVSSAAPACSGGFSKASNSPAAQTALPANGATPCAVPLPQAQLPAIPDDNIPGNSDSSAAQALEDRPVSSKAGSAQPADSPSQPTTASAEKNQLDFSLISLEDEQLVKEWLSGKRGVRVPSLQKKLPYLPPFLCNLKILSKLLLQKAALEEQAACLLPPAAGQGEGAGVGLHTIEELVQQKLGDNPAYLLLKARFLAAFTLPAVLATLPPPKVTTTLSGSRKQREESDEEEWQSERELSE